MAEHVRAAVVGAHAVACQQEHRGIPVDVAEQLADGAVERHIDVAQSGTQLRAGVRKIRYVLGVLIVPEIVAGSVALAEHRDLSAKRSRIIAAVLQKLAQAPSQLLG